MRGSRSMRHEHATGLLELAKNDVKAAEVLHRDEQVSKSSVGFHLQQAIEKALKAFMELHRLRYEWSHNLTYLFEELEEYADIQEFRSLELLGQFGVRYRYESFEADEFDWEVEIKK